MQQKRIRLVNVQFLPTMNAGNSNSGELLLENGRIVEIGQSVASRDVEQTIDAEGQLLIPGLTDVQVHFREPGFIHKEDIASGSQAAAKGGVTTVVCMPNTDPKITTAETLNDVLNKGRQHGNIRVLSTAGITRDSRPAADGSVKRELTDFATLKAAGAVAFTDDGEGVQDDHLMEKAFAAAKDVNASLWQHCEFMHLSGGHSLHEGKTSKKLEWPGQPSSCEWKMVERDIQLAAKYGVHYHVQHVSTCESVELIRQAKNRGVKVTAEVSPHHLLLCDEDVVERDADFKMNPPLRSKEDQKALVAGLVDGTIDIIATDHAPHAPEEKAQHFQKAPFGIIGLETALPLLYTHLVLPGILTIEKLIHLYSTRPNQLFDLPQSPIKEGELAEMVLVDLQTERSVDVERMASRSRNTPFKKWPLKGWPTMTFYQGEKVYASSRYRGLGC